MTPAEALEELLPRWKASLSADFSAEVVDDFVRRKRRILEDAVGQTLGILRLRRGRLPETPADFTAVGLLAERERRRHGTVDKDLARHLKKRRAELTEAANEADVLEALARRFEEYVLVRAEALLMGQLGWDAVPLLLRRPLLAVFSAGSVVIVHRHGVDGSEEAVFPGLQEESIADLRSDLSVAHEAATAITTAIGDNPEVIWARARGRGAAEIRRRAHVVCQRCGSRLRAPGPHYAIGTIECPGGEWLSAEEDAEEMQRRAEEARRRLAENPVPVFVPPDTREEKARRKADQQLRRREREREREEAARRRAAKATTRAQAKVDAEVAERFERGELPRTADELVALRRFAEERRPDEDQEDEALAAYRRHAARGRRSPPRMDPSPASGGAARPAPRRRHQERVIGGFDYVLLRAEGDPPPRARPRRPRSWSRGGAFLVEPGDTLHTGSTTPSTATSRPSSCSSAAASPGIDYFADAPSLEALRPLRGHDQVERLRREIAAMDHRALAPRSGRRRGRSPRPRKPPPQPRRARRLLRPHRPPSPSIASGGWSTRPAGRPGPRRSAHRAGRLQVHQGLAVARGLLVEVPADGGGQGGHRAGDGSALMETDR
ncbi:MAG: hypothetical protein R3B09_34370 [Nannocystaceae bacterium]